MATIEVDGEVYGWIQSLAKPLEDTPNSVLRRVAGLDKSDEPSPTEGATHRADCPHLLRTALSITAVRILRNCGE